MQKQDIECEFAVIKYWFNRSVVYTCTITEKIISEDKELNIIGEHKDGKTNQDVEVVSFDDCTISKIPQGLMKIFPKMEFLQIDNSKLNSVEREDLKEYKNLKVISLYNNEIMYLPGDLFADLKNLEGIFLQNNKTEVIEPNLLDGLEKLKVVNLTGNKCIDSAGSNSNKTLKKIKDEIKEKFATSPWKIIFDERNKSKKGICSDVEKIIQNENFKDFTVQVGEEEFKVHKFLLAARSPVLKEMIENNIDAEYLNLIDISKEIFREILNFIYTDEMPKSDDINFVHLYAAAGRLKIESLKLFAAEKLIDKVNLENALEILTLANKYESENLRQKSFEEIKKYLKKQILNENFGDDLELTDDLTMQPEKLKRLIDLKREKEEMMKKIKTQINQGFKKILEEN